MAHAPIRIVSTALGAALALAACGDAVPRAADQTATMPALDPALAAAIADPILVDPDLGQQANGDALRPPDRPPSGGLPPIDIAPIAPPPAPSHHAPAPRGTCPACTVARQSLTLGALAAAQPDAAMRGCAGSIRYSARWAARMPPSMPLPTDARVLVAAGTDAARCRLRAVHFFTALAPAGVIDLYAAHAGKGGFSAEHGADATIEALRGARDSDAAAYVVVARPRAGGGSMVDLVVGGAG